MFYYENRFANCINKHNIEELCVSQMIIVDLDSVYLESYFHCLEDWSEEIKGTGDHKRRWYQNRIEKKIARQVREKV